MRRGGRGDPPYRSFRFSFGSPRPQRSVGSARSEEKRCFNFRWLPPPGDLWRGGFPLLLQILRANLLFPMDRAEGTSVVMNWNFDMSQAPKGQYETETRIGKNGKPFEARVYRHIKIIAASGSSDVTTATRWLPEAERWEAFSKDFPPVAWMLWPEHPSKERQGA